MPVIRTTSLFKGLRQPLLGVLMAMASVSALAQAAPPAAASAASAPAGPTVRAEVGKPLREAQDLINARNGKDALPKIIEAEAVPNLTSFEAYAIARTKAIAAVGAGEPLLAITALEKTLASDHLPPADRVPLIDVMARLSLQVKDYARAALWLVRYKDAGGADPALRQQLPQVLVETNDFAGVVRESQILLKAEGGTLPLTWLADGKPLTSPPHTREAVFTPEGRGFVKLSVIDAKGRVDRVTVRVR